MKYQCIILTIACLIYHQLLQAQNLVPNPSFEDVSDCPNDFYQIYKSPPWYSPNCEPLRPDRHGYGILFTSKTPCTGDLTGVPKNVLCNETAHSGVSYAGVIGVSAYSIKMEYRQYVGTPLLATLVAGRRYLFSMYYYLCDGVRYGSEIVCFKNDSLGAFFSENRIDKNPNCQVLPFRPQVHGTGERILPSPVWRELVGGFTAKGNEQFLLIGNFADNAFSNCQPADSLGYYLFIDDVSLVGETKQQIDTVLCEVNDWKLDAQHLRPEYSTFRGWTYQWSDGNTDAVRNFTNPGAYTL
jgi:hypothetical protein